MNEDIEIRPKNVSDATYAKPQPVMQSETASGSFNTQEESTLHQQLMEWWTQAREIESINRYQQAIDEDFYDGLQWTDEDSETLRARGQAPLVYNRIKPTIDWILGTEKRTRIDFDVLPRRKEQNKEAEAKKERLKYLSDVNKTPFHRSRAFADAIKNGVGWLEDSIRGDDENEIIQTRYENWRNIWYDPMAVERDLSDARYLFRSKYVDYDIALAMFPNAKNALDQAVSALYTTGNEADAEDDFYFSTTFQQRDSQGNVLHRRSYSNTAMVYNRRKRVRLIECWYRQPISAKVMRGGEFAGQEYDETNDLHVTQVQEEFASLADALVMKMRVCIMTEGHLLYSMDSPYAHNDFPFTPIWGYRRSRDNSPYGVIRNLRDPQESLNKRHSKAIHILSTQQIIADEKAATDWDVIRDEAARPDGMILLDGAPGARFDLINDKQLAQQHVNLMELDAKMIQDVGGVTDENLGRDTNATSGKAIQARQEQGSIVTAELFDNLRYAIQLQGEKQLSLIEQFDVGENVIRVMGNRGATDYMPINTPKFDEQSGQWIMINPMTASQADFVVDEQDFRASMRQAMLDAMLNLVSKLPPEISLQLLDLVYENSDLPGRDEIVSRIRKINGQIGEGQEQTPEMLAEQQARQQQEQAQQEQQARAAELELALKQAQVDKIKADTTTQKVSSLFESLQTAQIIATIPGVAPIGDEIAKASGYIPVDGYPLVPPNQALANPVSIPSTAGTGKQQGINTIPNDSVNIN